MVNLDALMGESGVQHWGACPFAFVQNDLLDCRAKSRLPQNAKSIIMAAFPYHTGGAKGNLSRYAAVPDYHTIVRSRLEHAAEKLKNHYPQNGFAVFCDNSPIPEVRAAAMCGLGVVGKNSLLIHQKYGSWIFLGSIVTDLTLPPTGTMVEDCIGCGLCIKSCPGNALCGDHLKKDRCLSEISQKKAKLTDWEQELILKGNSVWGCDLCQECCPMNHGMECAPLDEFNHGFIPNVSFDSAQKLKDRAYHWRGPKVLERNLIILQKQFVK